MFRTRRDAEITLGIYRRHPVLIRKDDPIDGNPWGVSFMTMFHMSNDSGLFRTRAELEAGGWAREGNVFWRDDNAMLPLYQGQMTDFYDHRAADVLRSVSATKRQNQPRYLSDAEKNDPRRSAMPAYWVTSAEVEARLATRWKNDWLIGFSNITSPTNQRSLTPCLIPRFGVGHSTPLIFVKEMSFAFAALLCSFALDYLVRQKLGGTNMTYNYVEQFALPRRSMFTEKSRWASRQTVRDWVEDRVDELIYTAWDMAPAALALGDDGPPFVWDPGRRAVLRAELDSAFFHLYGIERDDMEYMMSTFPILIRKDPGLVDRVLDAYDRMATAMQTGTSFVSVLDPPPGEGRRHQAT